MKIVRIIKMAIFLIISLSERMILTLEVEPETLIL